MKINYDDSMLDEDEYDSFEKFDNSRNSMKNPVPHDKNKGQAIRSKRREKEEMKAEQEKEFIQD